MTTKRHHDKFHADLGSLLDSGKYADFTVTCRDRKWDVHKAIVCSQSAFLERACKFGKEAEERSVDLSVDDPEIVEHMLRFMYTRDYRLPSDDSPRPFWIRWKIRTQDLDVPVQEWRRAIEKATWSHSFEALEKLRRERSEFVENCQTKSIDVCRRLHTGHFDVNLEIYATVKSLVDNAYDEGSDSFRDGIRQPVSTEDCSIHAKVYSLADKYFVKGLKEVARDKFASCMRDSFAGRAFYDAVYIVFTTTPAADTGLRDLVLRRVSAEKRRYYLAVNSDLDDALNDIPGFAHALLRYEDGFGHIAAPRARM